MKKIPHIWQIVVSCEDLGGIFAARRQLLLNYRSWNSGWRTLWCGRRKIIIIHHKDVSITKITPSRNYNGFLPLCLCKNDIIQLDKQARGVEKSWVSSVNYDSTVSPKIRRSVIQEKVALSNFTIGQEKKPSPIDHGAFFYWWRLCLGHLLLLGKSLLALLYTFLETICDYSALL